MKASGEKKEYAGWALGVAALLAMSSLIPILVGMVVHLIKRFSSTNNKHAYDSGKFYRVDTTASTMPMLGEKYEVGLTDYHSTCYIVFLYLCMLYKTSLFRIFLTFLLVMRMILTVTVGQELSWMEELQKLSSWRSWIKVSRTSWG